MFLLVFVAHFAGCIFVMLLKQNTAWNWLKAYDEELLDEGDFTQYTVSPPHNRPSLSAVQKADQPCFCRSSARVSRF